MGLHTLSTGTLSSALLATAKDAADQFSSDERQALIKLISNERHFRQTATKWQPYNERLLSANVDRSNHQHLLALWLALRVKQYAAKNVEREQSKKRTQGAWGFRR